MSDDDGSITLNDGIISDVSIVEVLFKLNMKKFQPYTASNSVLIRFSNIDLFVCNFRFASFNAISSPLTLMCVQQTLEFVLPFKQLHLQGPQGSVDKPFLWTEGRVNLKASLNKSAYMHGENVNVTIDVRNDSRKIVRKVRVSVESF